MTIKSTLIYSLVFFIAMILVVGVVLVGSNTVQRYYAEQITNAVTLNGLVKVITREFDDARKSLRRYLNPLPQLYSTRRRIASTRLRRSW